MACLLRARRAAAPLEHRLPRIARRALCRHRMFATGVPLHLSCSFLSFVDAAPLEILRPLPLVMRRDLEHPVERVLGGLWRCGPHQQADLRQRLQIGQVTKVAQVEQRREMSVVT